MSPREYLVIGLAACAIVFYVIPYRLARRFRAARREYRRLAAVRRSHEAEERADRFLGV